MTGWEAHRLIGLEGHWLEEAWLCGLLAGRLGHAAARHSWDTGVTTHLAEPAKEGAKYCVDKLKEASQ